MQKMHVIPFKKVHGANNHYYDPSMYKNTKKFRLHPHQTVLITIDQDEQIDHYEQFVTRSMCGKKKTISCLYNNNLEKLGILLTNISRKPEAKVNYIPPNIFLSDILKMPNIKSKFTTLHVTENEEEMKEEEEEEEDGTCNEECKHSHENDD